MIVRGFALTTALWVLGVSAAQADPVTYAGTLGRSNIVVEFTADPASGEAVAGRYFYKSQGADIPLQANSGGKSLTLSEEGPCAADCEEGKPGPIGATWTLASVDGGKTLTGKWSGGKTYDLRLARVGSRPVEGEQPKTPLELSSFSFMAFYANDTKITKETSPYDFLKFDVAMEEGEVEGWPDASFRYVVDKRTKFPMPRLVELSGGASTDAANAVFWQRQAKYGIAALNCYSGQYAGFQEYGPVPGMEEPSLGGYDESISTVLALTPTLISWRESGSVFCGGAHPYNYSNAYTLNVSSGALLGLGDMFSDVVDGKPGPDLLAFIERTRRKPSDQVTIDFEEECGYPDLIAEYLSASLKRDGDRLSIVLGLQDLPHAINACADDVLELPVAEAEPLLKPEFAALLK